MLDPYFNSTREREIETGTTTVGVVCSDGVVLCSDRRASMGSFIAHKKTQKILQLDQNIASTIAGSVADARVVLDLVIAEIRLQKFSFPPDRMFPVKSASRFLANILYSRRYFPFILWAIVAGIDSSGPQIFKLDPLGSLVQEELFLATGSGSRVAYGLLEDKITEKSSIEETTPIVFRAVCAAMERDIATGNGLNLVQITEKEGYKAWSEEEIQTYADSLGIKILY